VTGTLAAELDDIIAARNAEIRHQGNWRRQPIELNSGPTVFVILDPENFAFPANMNVVYLDLMIIGTFQIEAVDGD